MVRISNLDIIKLLEENSRMSFVEIAERLGVSETAVRKKIKALEKEGIIRNFSIDIDYKKLGYSVCALTGLDTTPEKFIFVLEEVKKMKEAKKVYTSTGDHMIMIESILKDSSELTKFVEKLERMEGVTKVCPAILMERVK